MWTAQHTLWTTKKDRCEQPPMKDLVVIFIIFNHLTKLLFCLHYCISSDCSLTMSVKTSDPKTYFLIKNIASQICCFYFLFCMVRRGGVQLWSNDDGQSIFCDCYYSIMVYGEDDDLLRQNHRGDCCVMSLYKLYCYVSLPYQQRQQWIH